MLDDEAFARQLQAELNTAELLQERTRAENDRASLALIKQLEAEFNDIPSNNIETDAAFAAALAGIQQNDQQVERTRAAASKRSRRLAAQIAANELRQYLFTDNLQRQQPPLLPHGNMPSYANVVGNMASSSNDTTTITTTANNTTTFTQTRYVSPRLIIDGANIAHANKGYFDSTSIMQCVDYFTRNSSPPLLPRHAVAVTLSNSRWNENDPILQQLHHERILSLTPTGKYDDLFILKYADDNGAWIVTNDGWKEPAARRHATAAIRKRVIKYAFVGMCFVPAPDDMDRFERAL